MAAAESCCREINGSDGSELRAGLVLIEIYLGVSGRLFPPVLLSVCVIIFGEVMDGVAFELSCSRAGSNWIIGELRRRAEEYQLQRSVNNLFMIAIAVLGLGCIISLRNLIIYLFTDSVVE